MSENEKKKTSFVEELIDWIETLFFSFLTVVLLFTFVFRTSEVIGPSMYPTFVGRDDTTGQTGDMLIYLSCVNNYKNGDVVVVDSIAFNEPIIKRVIAVPGQTISVDYENGVVYVDGVALDEPYTASPTNNREDFNGPLTVPEGYVFVMGDNRNNSTDSRSNLVGLIREEYVMGRALFRVKPFGQFKIGQYE